MSGIINCFSINNELNIRNQDEGQIEIREKTEKPIGLKKGWNEFYRTLKIKIKKHIEYKNDNNLSNFINQEIIKLKNKYQTNEINKDSEIRKEASILWQSLNYIEKKYFVSKQFTKRERKNNNNISDIAPNENKSNLFDDNKDRNKKKYKKRYIDKDIYNFLKSMKKTPSIKRKNSAYFLFQKEFFNKDFLYKFPLSNPYTSQLKEIYENYDNKIIEFNQCRGKICEIWRNLEKFGF